MYVSIIDEKFRTGIQFFLLYRNEVSYKVKKLLIEAPPAGVRLRKQFCYSRNYNINVVISYIIKVLFPHKKLGNSY